MYSTFSKEDSTPASGIDNTKIKVIQVKPFIQTETDIATDIATPIKEPPKPSQTRAEIKKKKILPKNYLERIPIAGLYNYLNAYTKWDKRFWAVTLIAAAAVTLYYFVPCVITFIDFATVVEVRHRSEPKVPFPNVYACVSGGYNQTYFMNQVTSAFRIGNTSRVRRLAKTVNMTVTDLFWWTLAYMTHPPDVPSYFKKSWIPAFNDVIYRSILSFGSNWTGYGAFYEKGMFSCDKVLSKCTFNNVEFPCCPKGQKTAFSSSSMACFKVNVSEAFSNGSAKPAVSESYQLKFQTTIDTREIYVPYAILDFAGMFVNFGNHLASLFDGGNPVVSGTNMFVSVKAKRRQLYGNCIDRFSFNSEQHDPMSPVLREYFKEMETPENYSVEKCLLANLFAEVATRCGCVPHFDTIDPDDSIVCTPSHVYICFNRDFEADTDVRKIATAAAEKAQRDVRQQLKTRANKCLPLCDTWHYDPRITFAPLGGKQGNVSTIISNQIIVTMDAEYQQERDVVKIDLISFFATIGDGLSLFLGVSAVTFIQAIVWTIAACLLARKNRRVCPMEISATNRMVVLLPKRESCDSGVASNSVAPAGLVRVRRETLAIIDNNRFGTRKESVAIQI